MLVVLKYPPLLCSPTSSSSQQMCYSGVYFIAGFNSENRRNRLWASLVETRATEVSRHETSVRGAIRDGGPAGGTIMKQCICSPSRHPGSFRCRQHRTGYQWVGRLKHNPRKPCLSRHQPAVNSQGI